MPGTPLPRQRRAERHQFAAKRLAAGAPFATVVALVSDQWGCSRRQARNVCSKALDELVGDVDSLEAKQLLASCIHRLERLAMKAEASGQFGAAVGAVRTLHEMVLVPHKEKRGTHHR